MESLFHRLAWLASWVGENPFTAIFYATISVSALGTIANSLSYFPRAQAAVLSVARFLGALVKLAGDLMSLVANARGKGIAGPLSLPGVPTLEKSPLEDAQAPKGYVPLVALFSFVGAVVAGAFAAAGQGTLAVLWLILYGALLWLCAGAFSRGPSALLILAIASAFTGCAYVKATANAVKTCAGREVAQVDWNDLKPTVDGLLHMDKSAAFAGLGMLVDKYGAEFVTCLVSELKDEYQHILATLAEKPPPAALVEANIGPARAYLNATQWLDR